MFAERKDGDGLEVGSELNLEDLVTDVRSEAGLLSPTMPTIKRVVKPPGQTPDRPVPPTKQLGWARRLNLALEIAAVALVVGLIGLGISSWRSAGPTTSRSDGPGDVVVPADNRGIAGRREPDSVLFHPHSRKPNNAHVSHNRYTVSRCRNLLAIVKRVCRFSSNGRSCGSDLHTITKRQNNSCGL